MVTWRLGERIEKQGKKRQAEVRLCVYWFSPPHPLRSSCRGEGRRKHPGNLKDSKNVRAGDPLFWV